MTPSRGLLFDCKFLCNLRKLSFEAPVATMEYIVKFEHYQNVLQHYNNVPEQQRVGGGLHVPRAEGHGRQGGLPSALRLRLPHLQQHGPQGELRAMVKPALMYLLTFNM